MQRNADIGFFTKPSHFITTQTTVGSHDDSGKMLEVLKKDGVVAIATMGKNGPGTGFLIKGTAAFITSGPDFDVTRERFKWAQAALAVTIASVTQTL